MGFISSTGPRPRPCGPPGATAQPLAETMLSVEYTLGVGEWRTRSPPRSSA